MALIAAAPDTPPEPPLATQVLAAIAARGDRRTGFIEQRRLAALADPQTSRGILQYRRDGALEKRTDQPDAETLVVDKDRLIITEGSEAPRIVPLDARPGLRTLIDAIRAPLAGDRKTLEDDDTIETTGSVASWRMRLTPRDPAAASLLRDVTIEGTAGDIRHIVIRQANGDTDDMMLEPAP